MKAVIPVTGLGTRMFTMARQSLKKRSPWLINR